MLSYLWVGSLSPAASSQEEPFIRCQHLIQNQTKTSTVLHCRFLQVYTWVYFVFLYFCLSSPTPPSSESGVIRPPIDCSFLIYFSEYWILNWTGSSITSNRTQFCNHIFHLHLISEFVPYYRFTDLSRCLKCLRMMLTRRALEEK